MIVGGNRLLAFICIIMFVVYVGYGLVVPLLPTYTKELGVSDFQVGLLFASYAIALVLTAIPVGLISDRTSRKPFLVVGMIIMGLSFLLYAVGDSYWVLLLARVIDGCAAAGAWGASMALMGDRFEESEMGEKMGWALAALAMGGIAGPLVGGVFADLINYEAPFVLVTILCFVCAFIASLVEEDPSREKQQIPVGTMLRTVLGNRVIRVACLLTMLTTMGLGLIEPTLPIWLEENLGMSHSEIGILFGVGMLAYGGTSPVVGNFSDRRGRRSPIIIGLIASAAFAPFVVAFTSKLALFVFLPLFLSTFSIHETPTFPLITDSGNYKEGEALSYGTAFGLFNVAWSLGYAIGAVFGAALMEATSLFFALVAYSVILLASVPLVFIVLKDDSSQPAASNQAVS